MPNPNDKNKDQVSGKPKIDFIKNLEKNIAKNKTHINTVCNPLLPSILYLSSGNIPPNHLRANAPKMK